MLDNDIGFRVDDADKETVRRAAGVAGVSLSEFSRRAVMDAAVTVLALEGTDDDPADGQADDE